MILHEQNLSTSYKQNGRLNGQTNVSAKQSDKPNGVHPPRSTRIPKFSARFNGLFVLALLGAVWATVRSSSFGTDIHALCSPDGDRIYTVDGNNTSVQCVVVRDSHIVDTGSLGERLSGDIKSEFVPHL
jgi:hypothetical protein